MKLLLADDHTLFRDALVQYIERSESGASVDTVQDLESVLDYMSRQTVFPDLVLLDLCMPGMNGLEGLAALRARWPDVPVALMSGMAESEDVRAAMDMGAMGYFPKTLSGHALLKAIQLVLAGERYLPIERERNQIQPSYYGDSHENRKQAQQGAAAAAGKQGVLTARETEVLTFLKKGMSNKEIAREMDLQVVTVKLHVRGICRKLGAKNRTQAALIASEEHR